MQTAIPSKECAQPEGRKVFAARGAMRCGCALLLTCLAFGAQAAPMGQDEARHLLARTGFGAAPAEIARYAGYDRSAAVDRLLEETRSTPASPPPAVEHLPPRRLQQASGEEERLLLRRQFQQGAQLRGWWAQEMLRSPSPLTERMTLFWHNHFVSSIQKVKSGKLMLDQNLLLRRHALGNFAELLHAVSKDPAMLIYLDGAANRRDAPNENFAREAMELFTLGEGHYAETDVKEAARAFTGWSIEPESGAFRWRPFFHDEGVKTVLGRSGRLDGDGVLDILLARPETAEFVVAKLWREFVSPQPDPREVRRIAQGFRDSAYRIKPVLRELLTTPAFWATENRGTLIKSPVDLSIGTLRSLEIEVADGAPLGFVLRQLGQDLFAPPNVKGWPGGEAWIDSATLLARKQFLERLLRAGELALERRVSPRRVALRPQEMPNRDWSKGGSAREDEGRARLARLMDDLRFDASAWLRQTSRLGLRPENVLLAIAPTESRPPAAGDAVRALLLDPAYQVK